MPTTIALVDDLAAVRQGMALLISSISDLEVTVQASDGNELLEKLNTTTPLPDICLLDLSMKGMGGFETLEVLRRLFPSIKVLIYSIFLDEYNMLRSYKLGAQGTLPKEYEADTLKEALDEIKKGNYYIPPCAPKNVLKAIENQSIIIPSLTDREKEFLKLYCSGLSYSAIAEQMSISEKTADNHREHICTKLGIRGTIGLTLFAIKTGLIMLT
jgi:DNA-binding NarL/FixJ family response regulator